MSIIMEEVRAYRKYFSLATEALNILTNEHNMTISRGKAIACRDECKIKADKEIMLKCSSVGRFMRELGGEKLNRKHKYEAYDLMLAVMKINGESGISSRDFLEVAFNRDVYNKYFKEAFVEFEKNTIENEYTSDLTPEQKKAFAQIVIAQNEKLIPKYGYIPCVGQEERE